MHSNETRNQHFVSRVEQKLNACNPGSINGKFRIYSYRIVDRDKYLIELENNYGRQIESTLSMLDLYSFDVPGTNKIRMNLESLFQKYEKSIEVHTKDLLEKLDRGSADIKTEIVDLFAAKLLNFIRNPYCIEKVLNSFPEVASFEPTNPELLAIYRQIITGRKPHQTHLCKELGISDQTYIEWLRLIFILLMPIAYEQPNIFESTIKALFEQRDKQAAAFVFQYEKEHCLLSDRGFCQPLPDSPSMMSMSFNLCANAFIDYVFADPAPLVQGRASPEFLERTLAAWKQRPRLTVNVSRMKNNSEMLARYNRRVIEFSRERVYSSTKAPPIL